MGFRDFYYDLSPEERVDFATKCETSPAYLVHLINGRGTMQPHLAMLVEIHSQGKVLAETVCDKAPWAEWLNARVKRASAAQLVAMGATMQNACGATS